MKICGKCKKELIITEFSKDKSRKDELDHWCKNCRQQYQKEHKWIITHSSIKYRCENLKDVSHKCYAGKGIKCLISAEELKSLWFRDRAYLMNKPSIDRIDNNGNYIFNNCKYIELSENIKKGNNK